MNRSRRQPRAFSRLAPRAQAFTLIEFVLVIALLGVIVAAGSLSLHGVIPKYRVRSASRQVGTTIEQVRLTAISRGAWMGIRYTLTPGSREDPSKPYYQIIPPAPEDDPNRPVEEREGLSKEYFPDGVRITKVILSSNRVLDRGVVHVLFSPLGNSGSHVVVLEGDDGRKMSVKLNAITGVIDFIEDEETAFQNFTE